MRALSSLCILFLCSVLFSSCGFGCNRVKGGSKDSSESSTTPDNPAEALSKAFETMSGGDGKASEPVDHRKLRDLLKERISGFERTSYESQSAGAMGFNFSNAQADYEDGDKRINAAFTDTGGLGMAMMSMAAWSTLQIDREDQNGWERTGSWKGYKSLEKYDKSSEYSELTLIIENRFLVNLNGSNVDMDDLKDFADRLDLGELKKLI